MGTIRWPSEVINSIRTPIDVPGEVNKMFNAPECIKPENQSEVEDSVNMPIVDAFINPARRENIKMLTKRRQKKTENRSY